MKDWHQPFSGSCAARCGVQRRGGRKRIVAPDGSETVGAAEFEAWLDRLTGLDHAGRTVS